MKQASLIVPAKVDGETFRRFAFFDTFRRQKKLRAPLIFAAIMTLFAVVCLSQVGKRDSAGLLGGILLGLGFLMPATYLLNFWLSVKEQINRFGLKQGKVIYTLHLSEENIVVLAGQERAEFRWEAVHKLYRAKECLYLFVSPTRAFLMPQSSQTEAILHLAEKCLRPEQQQTL